MAAFVTIITWIASLIKLIYLIFFIITANIQVQKTSIQTLDL